MISWSVVRRSIASVSTRNVFVSHVFMAAWIAYWSIQWSAWSPICGALSGPEPHLNRLQIPEDIKHILLSVATSRLRSGNDVSFDDFIKGKDLDWISSCRTSSKAHWGCWCFTNPLMDTVKLLCGHKIDMNGRIRSLPWSGTRKRPQRLRQEGVARAVVTTSATACMLALIMRVICPISSGLSSSMIGDVACLSGNCLKQKRINSPGNGYTEMKSAKPWVG